MKDTNKIYYLTAIGSGFVVGGLASFLPEPKTQSLFYAGIGILSSALSNTYYSKLTGETQ